MTPRLTYDQIWAAIRPLCFNDDSCTAIVNLSMDEYRVIEQLTLDAQRQPGWCGGCNPDNCSGCNLGVQTGVAMKPDELPTLPEGMHWECWANLPVAVDPVHGGAVTIDFTRRNFALGWSTVYKPKGPFSGKGWKASLVAAAIQTLREAQA